MHDDFLDLPSGGSDAICYIADRAMLDAAMALIADYGAGAVIHASRRADASRNQGNVMSFCRWRQIERLLVALNEGSIGTVH
ncbi:MAG: hypothetical protein H2054_00875 [Sphingomonas sp.]|uniref:hypothetical protein n=1 Tax=Sphingomonas sp. TaxID=28214 RepID=UPI001812815D|nr:hypothetical protein [Zymomonas sp.]MBA4771644.1 hypothetical protein [Sphingomonas sp.]